MNWEKKIQNSYDEFIINKLNNALRDIHLINPDNNLKTSIIHVTSGKIP